MSSIVIAGDTSGSVTLAAPAVAGTVTVTLPSASGTMATTAGLSSYATLATPSFTTTIGVGGATASASGAGITFPTTQSASTNANTLDDYEEGSFSLTVTSASYTASPASGTYTKIGRLVYCKFFITLTAVNGSSNSRCGFSGLPFTNDGSQISGSAYEDTTSGSIYVTYVTANNTFISIQSYSGLTTGSARTLRVNEDYVGFITYQTS